MMNVRFFNLEFGI